jgi:hypothetical protein
MRKTLPDNQIFVIFIKIIASAIYSATVQINNDNAMAALRDLENRDSINIVENIYPGWPVVAGTQLTLSEFKIGLKTPNKHLPLH